MGMLITFKGATVKIIQQTTAFSKTGTFGGNGDSCQTANAEHGKEIFAGMSRYLTDFLEEFRKQNPFLIPNKGNTQTAVRIIPNGCLCIMYGAVALLKIYLTKYREMV